MISFTFEGVIREEIRFSESGRESQLAFNGPSAEAGHDHCYQGTYNLVGKTAAHEKMTNM